jgi:5-methylcytosine-specific restriction enzyme subunit McrC
MSPRTLRVFEHQTVRVGEALRAESGATVALTKSDFEGLVRFNDAGGKRFVEVGHNRIKFCNYVGYLQVGTLGIEILPKADRPASPRGEEGRWRQGLLKMIEVAGGMRLESPSAAAQTTARSSLLELVAARFTEETGRLLHEGLAKGYRDQEANGSTFRGRLLVAANIRENLAREDRFYVRYQEYDRDIVVNRILGAALDALRGLPLSAAVAARAVACRSAFPEVGALSPAPDLFERLAPGRSTARYNDALVLARMILEMHGPQLRAGKTPVFALLFDMNLLWERYVAALFRRAAVAGIAVSTQESRHFWKAHSRQSRAVRPDIVVRSTALNQPLLVVDTKWKVLRDGAPSDEDLKQMFVYNELFGAPRALLVYPSVSKESRDREGPFAGREHGCGTLHLGLFDDAGWSTAGMKGQVKDLLDAPSAARQRIPEPIPGR